MWMTVLSFWRDRQFMIVLVVLIMNMLVVVRYLDMRMRMFMPLRQMQPRTQRHQGARNK